MTTMNINDPLPDAHFGETALLRAAQRNDRAAIEQLLQAGADINQKSHWWAGGFNVLDNASHSPELVRFLIDRGATLDAPTAAGLDMFDALKAIVAADPAAVHTRGGDGQTALHRARSVEMARFLLDHGAEIDVLDVDHESTPAQYLIRDRPDVVRYLISRGCRTDILMAAALGDLALVRKHLDEHPDSIRTNVSPEYFPMRNPHAGGTIYIWTLGHQKTAHLLAREFKHDDVFELLMDRSPAELQLATACELGDEALVNATMVRNPNVASRITADDRVRVVAAAMNNNTVAVRLMLGAGWPADVHGHHNRTALHWAAFHGNADMTREILRHHPPLNEKESEWQAPPIGWAIYGSKHGWHQGYGDYAGTVEALLQAGAAPPAEHIDKLDTTESVRAVLRRYQS